MKTICSRLIAALLLPIVAGLEIAPAAIAGTYSPGVSAIYDAGTTPIGALYCIPDSDPSLVSKIPLIGDIDRALEGNQQRVGVNIRGVDRNAIYRQVDGVYTVVVAGGALRARGSISGNLDLFGGIAKSTTFRMGTQETFANADFVGRRFNPVSGQVSFRGTPESNTAIGEPVVTTECLLDRDVDQLDSQQQSQVIDAIITFFSYLAGRGRVRVRI
jgi:hypothetical protein